MRHQNIYNNWARAQLCPLVTDLEGESNVPEKPLSTIPQGTPSLFPQSPLLEPRPAPSFPSPSVLFVHLGSPVMGGGGGGSLISCWNPACPARLPLVLWSHFLNSQGKLLLQLFFRNSFPLFKHLHLYFGVNFHRLLLELWPCQARYLVYFIRFPHWPARRLPDTFVLTHGIWVLWNLCKVPGLK